MLRSAHRVLGSTTRRVVATPQVARWVLPITAQTHRRSPSTTTTASTSRWVRLFTPLYSLSFPHIYTSFICHCYV
jgi:DNA-binding transcriptional LysR family regulator